MPQVHRIGDIASGHGCPPFGEGFAPPTMAGSGSSNVFVNSMGVVRLSDIIIPHACTKGGPHSGVYLGSRNVFANSRPIQCVGDLISCTSMAISGSPNVIIG